MDLEKIEKDRREDPQLASLAFDSAEEVRRHLVRLHQLALEGSLGPLGYLYKQQTLRVRQLSKELENVRNKRK